MKHAHSVLVALSLGLAAFASAQAPTAESVMNDAKARAKAGGKNVFVVFHASWCGWCKKLDEFMAKPEFKPVFYENFVTVHLTVLENPAKKSEENPGGLELMNLMGGENAGLPFFAIVDPEGKTVITSITPASGQNKGQNVGHPVKPEEVAHFVEMLKKGAPKATPQQIEAMRAYLVAQKF